MERNEISLHEARLFLELKKANNWKTSKELATLAKISDRTARAHLLRFSRIGILDCAEVYPGHRYKLAKKADKRNSGFLRRIEAAVEVFGLPN